MNNLIKLLTLVLVSVLTFSCTKNENYYYTVENVTVTLDSRELLETVVKPMKSNSKTSSLKANATTQEYEHEFPKAYKAYFVSKETKGEYTKDQLVKVIDVIAGSNTITIPKLDYDVYVTNYTHTADKWYTWNNAIEQLPITSDKLYLYGKNNIDYSKVTQGTVELTNPYAAVMIKDNRWVNGSPKSYDTGQDYFKVTGWHVLYIRAKKTNTMVPISIAGNPNSSFTLDRPIQGNNIYQYTIDGSVPDLNDGNLGIIVKPFEKIVRETINL